MKVTGYQLREAIRRHELTRDTAYNMFQKVQHVFEGEKKVHPREVMQDFLRAEEAVVKLQEAQQKYNLEVSVDVQGQKLTLCSAVKRLGGAGRAEKMWRDAVCEKKERYGSSYQQLERQEGTIVAQKVLGYEETLTAANKAAGYAGALRAAVALGNSTVVDISLDETLLR